MKQMRTQEAKDGARGSHGDQVTEEEGGDGPSQPREKVDCSKRGVTHNALHLWSNAVESPDVES